MKRILASLLSGLLLTALASPAMAQQKESQESLQKKYDEKVGEAWVKDPAWILDFDKAREEAKKSGKGIVAYFTRSYSP